ncbi:hypothetical protein Hanom_Chr08g00746111 [Helianthus anomalus]
MQPSSSMFFFTETLLNLAANTFNITLLHLSLFVSSSKVRLQSSCRVERFLWGDMGITWLRLNC